MPYENVQIIDLSELVSDRLELIGFNFKLHVYEEILYCDGSASYRRQFKFSQKKGRPKKISNTKLEPDKNSGLKPLLKKTLKSLKHPLFRETHRMLLLHNKNNKYKLPNFSRTKFKVGTKLLGYTVKPDFVISHHFGRNKYSKHTEL